MPSEINEPTYILHTPVARSRVSQCSRIPQIIATADFP